MTAYQLKCVSDFIADGFFVLFSWTDLLNNTPWRTKILIFPVWNKIFKIWDTFWAHANRSTMQQKLFQNVFTTRSWSFWKRNRKSHAQNWKNIYSKFWQRIFTLSAIQCKRYFLQTCINFCRTTTQIFSLWRYHNTLNYKSKVKFILYSYTYN